jgi:hypothetical protein
VHYLRRNLAGKDAETSNRMAVLIKELGAAEFRRRLGELAKEKAEAPIDLVAELLLEHREDVDDRAWKLVMDIVGAVWGKVTKERGIIVPLPSAHKNYLQLQFFQGDKLSRSRVIGSRTIANHFQLEKTPALSDCTVIARELNALEDLDCGDDILLLTGIPGKKPPPFKVESIGTTILYCDGDVQSTLIDNSIIITRGRVKTDVNRKSIAFERARNSPGVSLFSAERIGLSLKSESGIIQVVRVAPNTAAGKVGIKDGDVIETEADESIGSLECRIRGVFAKQGDLTLRIRRADAQRIFVLPLID